MKIFFAGSPRGHKDSHLDDDLIEQDYASFENKLKEGRSAYVAWYQKKINGINLSDICVFETSIHSIGVGFLIQKALDQSKPVIVLYYKKNIPYFLSGVEDDKLLSVSYDETNYKRVLKKSLDQAREKRDKRFNFFLSPKLLQYIDDASKERGITKSKLLRDMIVNHMRDSDS
jgi:hypothetical protein